MRRRALLLLAAPLAVAGCEWFSTMADSAGISPHEREPLLPPPHAVPLDGLPEFDLATADAALTAPPADSGAVARGEAAYLDFCYVCHGPGGRGAGPVSRVFPAIPAVDTDRVAGYTDAYLFAVITKGRGLMPDYGRIPPDRRWDIVAYLRSLPRGAGAPAAGTAPAASTPADTGGAP